MNRTVILQPLSMGDLDFANHLVAQAGWNQTSDDWKNLLQSNRAACFMALSDGVPAGTVSVVNHGGGLAWIGMLLVEESFRGKGIGKALMEKAMEAARARGATCLGLDATPAGRPLYEKLGFVVRAELNRWEGTVPQLAEAETLPSIEPRHGAGIARLDHSAFGVDRTEWLHALTKISTSAVVAEGEDVCAFGLLRPGRKAFYLGPVVAADELSVQRVVRSLLRHVEGKKVYWDAFDTSSRDESGSPADYALTRQRPFYRMLLGTAPTAMEQRQIAIADPATG